VDIHGRLLSAQYGDWYVDGSLALSRMPLRSLILCERRERKMKEKDSRSRSFQVDATFTQQKTMNSENLFQFILIVLFVYFIVLLRSSASD